MTRRVAVVVCHGMGQQVAFDTLATVATAVAGQLEIDPPDIRTRLVSNGDRYLARAELAVPGANENASSVHFYESYWAPLVEGKVNLFDTLRFLVDAGLTGVRFALLQGEFDRWMFHTQQRFEIPARRVYQFGTAVWVLVLLSFAYIAYGAALISGFAHLFGLTAPEALHTADFLALCWTFVWTAVISAVVGAIAASVWLAVLRVFKRGTRVRVSLNPLTSVRSNIALRILSLVFVLLLVLHEIAVMRNERWPDMLRWIYQGDPHARTILMALVLGGVLYGVANFLVNYVGDVAAYVSPYKVSKFQEIRSSIQAVGHGVTQHVYTALDENGAPQYDDVYFVGHSLGSVVAYDCLNDALARDARVGGWAAGSPEGAFDVVGRTKLLLTFGSPLDKTAFVFRTHGQSHPALREKVAAHVQPLIFDHDNRERVRWVNLWSVFDWISGSLEYYDEGERLTRVHISTGTDVRNVRTKASLFPWVAHTSYWSKPAMPAVIARAITGNNPKSLDEGMSDAIQQAFT